MPEPSLAADLLDIAWFVRPHGQDDPCCGDLSAAEARALAAAAGGDCRTLQDIAADLGVTRSGATRVVDRLEKRGLATRCCSSVDRRCTCVELTDARPRAPSTRPPAASARSSNPCWRHSRRPSGSTLASSLATLAGLVRRHRHERTLPMTEKRTHQDQLDVVRARFAGIARDARSSLLRRRRAAHPRPAHGGAPAGLHRGAARRAAAGRGPLPRLRQPPHRGAAGARHDRARPRLGRRLRLLHRRRAGGPRGPGDRGRHDAGDARPRPRQRRRPPQRGVPARRAGAPAGGRRHRGRDPLQLRGQPGAGQGAGLPRGLPGAAQRRPACDQRRGAGGRFPARDPRRATARCRRASPAPRRWPRWRATCARPASPTSAWRSTTGAASSSRTGSRARGRRTTCRRRSSRRGSRRASDRVSWPGCYCYRAIPRRRRTWGPTPRGSAPGSPRWAR